MSSIKQLFFFLFYKFRNLILYGIIGGFSATVDFLVYYLLTSYFEVFYLFANIISVTIGVIISFTLNKNFNFKVKDKIFKRFLIFVSVGFSGLLLSSALLSLFINILDLIISKFLSIIFVVIIQFFLNKFITFKKECYE